MARNVLPSLLKARVHLPCSTASITGLVKATTTTQSVQQCRWYQVQQGTRGLPCLASGVVGRVDGGRRWASTKPAEEDGTQQQQQQQQTSPEQTPLFQRFWRWLHDLDDLDRFDNPPDSKTQAEIDEREAFLNRVQAMYFADPPQTPNIEFCRESLDMLMKYNDRVAVETLWRILPELKVTPDEELETRVRLYLKKARLEAYYE